MEDRDLENLKSQGRLDSRGSYPEGGEQSQDEMEKQSQGRPHTEKIHQQTEPPKRKRGRPRKSDLGDLNRNQR